MSSSFVGFRKSGFWAHDSQTAVFTYVFCQEIVFDRSADGPPQWLWDAVIEWHHHATEGFGGFRGIDLDRLVDDSEERRLELIALFRRIIDRMNKVQVIPATELSRMNVENDDDWQEDVIASQVALIAEYYIKTLNEEIAPPPGRDKGPSILELSLWNRFKESTDTP